MNLQELIKHYIQDSDAFGDTDGQSIQEVMEGFNSSLSTLTEHSNESYKNVIQEYRNNLHEDKRLIFEDFIKYCKHVLS